MRVVEPVSWRGRSPRSRCRGSRREARRMRPRAPHARRPALSWTAVKSSRTRPASIGASNKASNASRTVPSGSRWLRVPAARPCASKRRTRRRRHPRRRQGPSRSPVDRVGTANGSAGRTDLGSRIADRANFASLGLRVPLALVKRRSSRGPLRKRCAVRR